MTAVESISSAFRRHVGPEQPKTVIVLVLTVDGVFSGSSGCHCETCADALRKSFEEIVAEQNAARREAMN